MPPFDGNYYRKVNIIIMRGYWSMAPESYIHSRKSLPSNATLGSWILSVEFVARGNIVAECSVWKSERRISFEVGSYGRLNVPASEFVVDLIIPLSGKFV